MSVTGDFQPFAYPDLRDPRVMVCIPALGWDAMTSLWALVERLLSIVTHAREPALAQIKLAWWRETLGQLAAHADAIPKGEPLLADLQRDWHGSTELAALTDPVEALLLADDDPAAICAATELGRLVWDLTRKDQAGRGDGAVWGLVAAATVLPNLSRATALFAHAKALPTCAGGGRGRARALVMLGRWARYIARRGGERDLRAEALLLLRVGLFGR